MTKGNHHKIQVFSVVFLMAAMMLPGVVCGQTYHTKSKRAIASYKKAKEQYSKKNTEKTLKYLDKALYSDADFLEAIQLKGDVAIRMGDDDMALNNYEKSLAVDSMAYPKDAIVLANLYTKRCDYDDAVKILRWYCGLSGQKEASIKSAKIMLENSIFRANAVKNPVPYNPVNLGANVNTDGDEYVNQIIPDGTRMYFTRRLNEKDPSGYRIEKVYYSSMVDGMNLEAVPMDLDWNNNKRMGAVNISFDNRTMYFVGFDWLDSQGRGDIYESKFNGSSWEKPVNLGKIINTSTVESQPCISYDCKELFFTRYSRSYETTDIYVSSLEDGKWTNPQSIAPINSKGNDMSPFLHPDGKTLYFASDGLPGMGGYDIFVCKRDEAGVWGEPVNLGYPINTPGDEISFAVSTDGKTGYISSIREEGFGGFDIYSFEITGDNKPDEVDVNRFVLHNVVFELNSSKLLETSIAEIDSVASYMLANPKLKAEVSGYSDNSGSSEHNLLLSKQRADSVKKALINKGVSAKRIISTGFGENSPIVPNDSEEHMAMNRRVEIRFY